MITQCEVSLSRIHCTAAYSVLPCIHFCLFESVRNVYLDNCPWCRVLRHQELELLALNRYLHGLSWSSVRRHLDGNNLRCGLTRRARGHEGRRLLLWLRRGCVPPRLCVIKGSLVDDDRLVKLLSPPLRTDPPLGRILVVY
jgi:hypothetical protein